MGHRSILHAAVVSLTRRSMKFVMIRTDIFLSCLLSALGHVRCRQYILCIPVFRYRESQYWCNCEPLVRALYKGLGQQNIWRQSKAHGCGVCAQVHKVYAGGSTWRCAENELAQILYLRQQHFRTHDLVFWWLRCTRTDLRYVCRCSEVIEYGRRGCVSIFAGRRIAFGMQDR